MQKVKSSEILKETLKNLSKQLIEEFGRGYSMDNLQCMRKFYLMFKKRISNEITKTSGKYETPSRNSVFTLS